MIMKASSMTWIRNFKKFINVLLNVLQMKDPSQNKKTKEWGWWLKREWKEKVEIATHLRLCEVLQTWIDSEWRRLSENCQLATA